jgi:hypothetical protein
MAAQKGHEKIGGRSKGTPNKKTAQWEAFSEYCLNGGLQRFEQELNTLEGKDYVNAFTALLEFHKPKLARTTMQHEGEVTIKQVTGMEVK